MTAAESWAKAQRFMATRLFNPASPWSYAGAFIAATLASLILWWILGLPVLALKHLFTAGYADDCRWIFPNDPSLPGCAFGFGSLTVLAPVLLAITIFVFRGTITKALKPQVERVPQAYRWLAVPALTVVVFLVSWAGLHYRIAFRWGIVPQFVFPAVVAVIALATVMHGARMQGAMKGWFEARENVDKKIRYGLAIAVPFLLGFLLMKFAPAASQFQSSFSWNLVREQLVVLLAVLTGWLLLAPSQSGPSARTAAATTSIVWLAVPLIALLLPMAAAHCPDPVLCDYSGNYGAAVVGGTAFSAEVSAVTAVLISIGLGTSVVSGIEPESTLVTGRRDDREDGDGGDGREAASEPVELDHGPMTEFPSTSDAESVPAEPAMEAGTEAPDGSGAEAAEEASDETVGATEVAAEEPAEEPTEEPAEEPISEQAQDQPERAGAADEPTAPDDEPSLQGQVDDGPEPKPAGSPPEEVEKDPDPEPPAPDPSATAAIGTVGGEGGAAAAAAQPPGPEAPPDDEAPDTPRNQVQSAKDASETASTMLDVFSGFASGVQDRIDQAREGIKDAGKWLGGLLDGEDKKQADDTLGRLDDALGQAGDMAKDAADKAGKVKDRVDQVTGGLEKVDEYMETAEETIDRSRDMGLNGIQTDSLTWFRVTFKGAGEAVNKWRDSLIDRFGGFLGEDGKEKVKEVLPAGEFVEEVGKLPTSGAQNIRGGGSNPNAVEFRERFGLYDFGDDWEDRLYDDDF